MRLYIFFKEAGYGVDTKLVYYCIDKDNRLEPVSIINYITLFECARTECDDDRLMLNLSEHTCILVDEVGSFIDYREYIGEFGTGNPFVDDWACIKLDVEEGSDLYKAIREGKLSKIDFYLAWIVDNDDKNYSVDSFYHVFNTLKDVKYFCNTKKIKYSYNIITGKGYGGDDTDTTNITFERFRLNSKLCVDISNIEAIDARYLLWDWGTSSCLGYTKDMNVIKDIAESKIFDNERYMVYRLLRANDKIVIFWDKIDGFTGLAVKPLSGTPVDIENELVPKEVARIKLLL